MQTDPHELHHLLEAVLEADWFMETPWKAAMAAKSAASASEPLVDKEESDSAMEPSPSSWYCRPMSRGNQEVS